MKITSFKNYFSTLFMFVFLSNAFGQTMDENLNLLLVREDKVSPSMSVDYEMSLTDLKNFLTENNVQNFNYFTHLQDDYRFTHIVPIDDMDNLRDGTREALKNKINKPELDIILDYFDLSVESYYQYIIQYQPNLSYVTTAENWQENNPYRKWNFYYFFPGNETEVEELLAAYKYLYGKKKVSMGFRIFTGLIGTSKPLYILTTWGESPIDYHENLEKASKLLGEEGAILWTKLMALVRETKTVEGWFLPQYSYAPGMKMAE